MTKKNSSEYWEDRIASSTWKTYNSLEEKNRDLLDFFTDASKSVKEELYTLAEKYSKDGALTLSEMHKQNRLTELNKKYEKIALELGKQTEKTASKNMQDGFREVYKNTAVGIGDIDFSMPNKKLMEKLLNEPWRGDSFSGRLWKNQKKLAAGLNSLLLTGLQQGKTVTEIAVGLHNIMGNAFNDCHRLVRTETMHYLNSATLQRYKDSGVEYVQIWVAQDERTCETCRKYHGKVYPIDKCPILPFHANCRCTVIPCFDERLIKKYQIQNGLKQADSVEKEFYSDIIKERRFNTEDDPIREVIGSAEESHPKELKKIISDLTKAGVQIHRRENAMGYSPALAPGRPGELLIEEGASYSAWLHEYRHFCDDRTDGYLGMRVFADTEKCIQRELDAYQIEIEFAEKSNRPDIVKRLKKLRDKEVAKYGK